MNALRQRAYQIARDADWRALAPKDFFTTGGQQIEPEPGRHHVTGP
ncbi:MAG TPA: hypothetical protein VHW09_20005 [Bryobacteraceae bacterium]|nr:hypothetical protein [Bryobacteraceae bacterium]